MTRFVFSAFPCINFSRENGVTTYQMELSKVEHNTIQASDVNTAHRLFREMAADYAKRFPNVVLKCGLHVCKRTANNRAPNGFKQMDRAGHFDLFVNVPRDAVKAAA